jgi:spore coat polysaccharide biosynthesis predicted glycosyltransferase SpsG
MPRVFFAIEAGGRYGLGHLIRCGVLADALHERGAAFAAAIRHGNDILPETAFSHAERFGIENDEDVNAAAEAAQAAARWKCDWAVVDGYGLIAGGLVGALQQGGMKVLAFDDVGNLGGGADIVVNQNVPMEKAGAYSEKLFGSQYALVDPAYAAGRGRPVAEKVERVLVTFGGADRHGLTAPTISALSKLPLLRAIDVVVGPYHQEPRVDMQARARVNLHRGLTSLAGLLADAQIVISAGGSTCWQVCCSGVPLIAVQTADNQQQVLRSLAEQGAAVCCETNEFLHRLRTSGLRELLQPFEGVQFRRQMIAAQHALVDGRGASRIAAAMGI